MAYDTLRTRFAFILSLVLCACACSAYIFFLVTITHTWQVAEQSVHRRALARAEEEQAFQVERALHSNTANMAALDTLFLSESAVPQFIGKLETIAALLQVTTHLSSLTTDTGKTAQGLSISMVIDGTYADIVRFVRAVELLPFRVSVSSLALVQTSVSATRDASSLPLPEQKTTKIGAEPKAWSATLNFRVVSFRADSTTPQE